MPWSPTRGWLESSYRSDLFRALWAPWVLHLGLGPESAYSGKMTKVIAFATEAAGTPIVKGGAKNLLAAFRKLIEDKGGAIRTNADVVSVERDRIGCGRIGEASRRRTHRSRARRDLLDDADTALYAAA